jgi:hypothetical protein
MCAQGRLTPQNGGFQPGQQPRCTRATTTPTPMAAVHPRPLALSLSLSLSLSPLSHLPSGGGAGCVSLAVYSVDLTLRGRAAAAESDDETAVYFAAPPGDRTRGPRRHFALVFAGPIGMLHINENGVRRDDIMPPPPRRPRAAALGLSDPAAGGPRGAHPFPSSRQGARLLRALGSVYDAFGGFCGILPENIGIFQSSFPEMRQIYQNTPVVRPGLNSAAAAAAAAAGLRRAAAHLPLCRRSGDALLASGAAPVVNVLRRARGAGHVRPPRRRRPG